jgi:hypothetical protein
MSHADGTRFSIEALAWLERLREGRTDAGLSIALLLLQRRSVACAGRRSHTEWVLAVGQTDPTVLDQAAESVSVQLVQCLRSILHILKLNKAHWAVAFLPEA